MFPTLPLWFIAAIKILCRYVVVPAVIIGAPVAIATLLWGPGTPVTWAAWDPNDPNSVPLQGVDICNYITGSGATIGKVLLACLGLAFGVFFAVWGYRRIRSFLGR